MKKEARKGKRNKPLADMVPPLKEIEGHFSFIKNRTLRINMSIAFQYILTLIGVLDKEKAEGTTIANAIYKDMIVYYATIAESALHYCLRIYIDEDIIKSSKVMPSEWKYKNWSPFYKINDKEEACGVIRSRETGRLTRNTNFIVINRASFKAKILNKKLFNKVEALRKRRNKIHLAGLNAIDNSYTKANVQRAEYTMTEIIERVKNKLEKIE
jgi:hypothetical protein